MFFLMIILGIVTLIGGVSLCLKDQKIFGVICFVICLALFVGACFTAQGKLYLKQLGASAKTGSWLIVDNSGGETLRHWVLEQGYVESSSQSDGWMFFDQNGNLCYVSGDAFVQKINQSLEEFKTTYKKDYNIPEEQKALH